MKQIAGKLLDTKVEGGANLHAQVDKALHAEVDRQAAAEGSIVADLRMMQDMGAALATLVPQIVSKLGKLVQTGQAL
ncbi:MAG: hypothetical protein JWM74_6240, partial [Myxococcaceae bacterium]|nr:hypothetical protein [Myxococcaceae bacterium]